MSALLTEEVVRSPALVWLKRIQRRNERWARKAKGKPLADFEEMMRRVYGVSLHDDQALAVARRRDIEESERLLEELRNLFPELARWGFLQTHRLERNFGCLRTFSVGKCWTVEICEQGLVFCDILRGKKMPISVEDASSILPKISAKAYLQRFVIRTEIEILARLAALVPKESSVFLKNTPEGKLFVGPDGFRIRKAGKPIETALPVDGVFRILAGETCFELARIEALAELESQISRWKIEC